MTSIDSRTIGSFALRTPNRTRCRKSPPTTFRAGWRPPPLASWIIVVFGSAAKRFAIGDEKLEVACVWLIDAYRAFVEGQRRFRAGVGSFDACLHTAKVQRRPSDARADLRVSHERGKCGSHFRSNNRNCAPSQLCISSASAFSMAAPSPVFNVSPDTETSP